VNKANHAVKGKNYETKKKGTTMNSLPRLKKNTNCATPQS